MTIIKNIFKLGKYSTIILLIIFSFSLIFFISDQSDLANGEPVGSNVQSLAIEQPGVIYATQTWFEGWCHCNSWVLKTTNDGKNWFHSEVFIGGIGPLIVEKPGVAYFAANGVYKTTNGGMKWFRIGNIETYIHSLIIEQVGIFYGVGDNTIYKTTNGGENWFDIFPYDSSFISIAIEKPEIVYAKTENVLYKTTNGGLNWKPIGERINIRNLTIEQPGILYAFDPHKGILKTTNDGEKWFSIFKLSDISSLAVEKPGIVYAGSYYGLYKTTNGGLTWFQIGFTGMSASCLEVVQPGLVYCSSGYGVYKTTNGGANWILIGPGSTKTLVRCCEYDRYTTARYISYITYHLGADTVVLARGEDFADALCGAPLAAKYNAPLLLNHSQLLLSDVEGEIRRLKAKEVIMLGSTDALSDNVLESIKNIGIPNEKIHRISGATRYETSAEIAKWLDSPENKSAFIATGENYPDALSTSSIAASYGMPILLVRGDRGEIPQAIQNVLKEKGIKRTLIVGGSDVIPEGIASWLDKNNYSSRRISGETRYETNINLVSYCLNQNENNPRLAMNPYNIFVAYGENFPDALTSGVMAAKTKSPLILTRNNFVPSSSRNFFSSNKDTINVITIVGGEDVVSNKVVEEIRGMIK